MKYFQHKTFNDNRGSFTPFLTDNLGESWNQFSVSINDNEFTFRGLHYQTSPRQLKYVKVVKGSIVDFSVDIETGETKYMVLTEDDAVLIPDDKAHGFLTLEPDTIVCYMVKGEYDPSSEKSIVYDTIEEVNQIIKDYVGNHEITISEKDKLGK
jgi:dTDP-4-dehydrorhamnose 3,5-epimerase